MSEHADKTPTNIAIIMDGNRRYAKKMGLEARMGHEAGAQKLLEVLKWVSETPIQNIAVYAFSTENWNRSEKEVSDLLALFSSVLRSPEIVALDMNVKIIGDIHKFPLALRTSILALEKAKNVPKRKTLWVALSYGGKSDILHAVRELSHTTEITEASFEKHLLSAGLPDIDLVIRTGGAMRLSNFLPWQTAYSELFFVSEFWPEFKKEQFVTILREYALRKRNFGK